jgi:hypothetical protein
MLLKKLAYTMSMLVLLGVHETPER